MLNFLMTQHLHYHNLSVVYKKSKRRLISTQHDIICMILYSLWDVMVDGCCDPQHSAINRQAAVSLIYTRRNITLLFSIYNMNRYVQTSRLYFQMKAFHEYKENRLLSACTTFFFSKKKKRGVYKQRVQIKQLICCATLFLYISFDISAA